MERRCLTYFMHLQRDEDGKFRGIRHVCGVCSTCTRCCGAGGAPPSRLQWSQCWGRAQIRISCTLITDQADAYVRAPCGWQPNHNRCPWSEGEGARGVLPLFWGGRAWRASCGGSRQGRRGRKHSVFGARMEGRDGGWGRGEHKRRGGFQSRWTSILV